MTEARTLRPQDRTGTRARLWTVFAAAVLLASCASPTAQSVNGAANPHDLDFITNAYQIILFDRQEGQLAQTEAKDPEVRALAAQLLDEANRFAAELAPAAAELGIKPPTDLRYNLRVRLTHMRLQHGLGFDEGYIDDQIASHEETLSAQEAMPNSGASPSIVGLAMRGTDLVRANLQKLKAVQRRMMMQGS